MGGLLSFMQIRRWLRDRAEAVAVRSSVAAARFLSMRSSVRLGERLGELVGRFDRRRRAVAFANLELAYGGTLAPKERAAIVNGVYRHLGRLYFEYLLLLTDSSLRPLSRFVEFDDGLERTRAALREHGAAIFVTLHQGHWELLGGAFSELATPLHVVVKPVRNPLLSQRVIELNRQVGMVSIERRRAVPALFRHLRRGQSIALFCDLNQRTGPAFVDFFGVPAATVRTPALLAVRTGRPVICGTSWSTGSPLSYRATIGPPIVPRRDCDPDAEAGRILVEMNRQLESFVRAHPDQWNWIHARWRTRPQDGALRTSP